jgi:hypothetical protein
MRSVDFKSLIKKRKGEKMRKKTIRAIQTSVLLAVFVIIGCAEQKKPAKVEGWWQFSIPVWAKEGSSSAQSLHYQNLIMFMKDVDGNIDIKALDLEEWRLEKEEGDDYCVTYDESVNENTIYFSRANYEERWVQAELKDVIFFSSFLRLYGEKTGDNLAGNVWFWEAPEGTEQGIRKGNEWQESYLGDPVKLSLKQGKTEKFSAYFMGPETKMQGAEINSNSGEDFSVFKTSSFAMTSYGNFTRCPSPYLILKNPAVIGDSWTTTYEDDGLVIKSTVTIDSMTSVETPKENFTDAIKTKINITYEGDTSDLDSNPPYSCERWFVKGIGLVKYATYNNSGSIIAEAALSNYQLSSASADDILPLSQGNSWDYKDEDGQNMKWTVESTADVPRTN